MCPHWRHSAYEPYRSLLECMSPLHLAQFFSFSITFFLLFLSGFVAGPPFFTVKNMLLSNFG